MDRETFHRFYQETASALRAYLRLSCRNWPLADDLMQETYLRMLRQQLPALDAAQRKAYLYKTAHSVLADHYRARRRETRWNAEHSTRAAFATHATQAHHVTHATHSSHSSHSSHSTRSTHSTRSSRVAVEGVELDSALELGDRTVLEPLDVLEPLEPLDPLELPLDMQRMFDTLKAKQQTLLWLAYVEGFTHPEIAEVMGVNASSVRVLLSRARAELAAKLSDERAAYRAGGKGAS